VSYIAIRYIAGSSAPLRIDIIRGSAACPVRAVKQWLATAGITEGALFRPVPGEVSAERLAPRGVANIVKSYARRLGLNVSDFSAHSLRSGFLTCCGCQLDEEAVAVGQQFCLE
jgi:integrase